MRLRVFLVLGVLAIAGTAQAQRRVTVSWSGPPECGAGEDVYPLIAEHLGRSLEDRDVLSARVEIAAHASGYSARVRFADASAERVIDGGSCGAVMDAAALILAMALRESAVAPHPVPPPPDGVRRVSVDSGARRWGFAVRLDGVGAVGVMPGAGVGAGASARVVVGAWRVGLEGAMWRDGDASLGAFPEAGAMIELRTGALLGCRSIGAGTLVGCGGLEVGSMEATAYGFEDAGRGRELWLAALGRIEASLALGFGVTLVGAADLVVPASAPRFVLDDGTEIYAARGAGLRLRAGVEVRIY